VRRDGPLVARRRARRRRLRVAGLLVLWVCLGGAVVAIGMPRLQTAGWLDVRRVELRGEVLEPREELQACLESLEGENLLSAPYGEAAGCLLRRPRVREVGWELRPPHGVVFTIEEREGRALVSCGGLHEIDGEGILLPPGPTRVPPDLPILTGVDCGGLVPGARLDEEGVRDALRVVGLLRAAGFDTARLLSEIRIRKEGLVLIWQEGDGSVVVLGDGPYEEPILHFRGAYASLVRSGRFPERIDLRFDRQVVVSYGP
jgi:hypothetical protein